MAGNSTDRIRAASHTYKRAVVDALEGRLTRKQFDAKAMDSVNVISASADRLDDGQARSMIDLLQTVNDEMWTMARVHDEVRFWVRPYVSRIAAIMRRVGL